MSAAGEGPGESPYAGPRPFSESQSRFFFGRDRETADLYSLVVSHRVVLLYAQSGAGKTSLLQAGLLPRLRERYRVYGPARVSGLIPPEVKVADIANIYAFHVVQSWATQGMDTSGAAGPDAASLARTTLAEFLGLKPIDPESGTAEAEKRKGAPTVLILDQLEEVFRLYPERWEDRARFFAQLRDVVEWAPHVRVLLAMREDWIAELDPYTRLFWDRLHVRFRLECLRRPQALAAVTGPLARLTERRCTFAADAAEKLVTDLLTFRAVDAEGTTVPVVGEFVEPVQLQVVCERLWQRLPPETSLITLTDVEQLGDANAALGDFYVECIRDAARTAGITEGVLRTRFAKAFIGAGETRRMVPREREGNNVEGIPVEALEALEARLLIRRESRGAHTWYELSHDRFVNPILRSNEAWFQQLGTAVDFKRHLEARADQWLASQRRDKSLLLRRRGELRKAERWRQSPVAVELGVAPAVDELLNASRMHLRTRRLVTYVAVVVPLSLLSVLGVSYVLHRLTISALVVKASEQTAVARALLMDSYQSRELVAKRKAFAEKLTDDAQRAEDNARRAEQEKRPPEEVAHERDRAKDLRDRARTAEADAAVRSETPRKREGEAKEALEGAWGLRLNAERPFPRWQDAWNLIVAPKPRARAQDLMAAADRIQRAAKLLTDDAQRAEDNARRAEQEKRPPEEVARERDRARDLRDRAKAAEETRMLVLLQALAATPSDDRMKAVLREALGPFEELARLGPADAVWGMALRGNGREVATSDSDGRVRIWNTQTGALRHFDAHNDHVNAVAFSPDGRLLATAGFDGRARVWMIGPDQTRGAPEKLCELGDRGGKRIFQVAFDPRGTRVATAGEDGRARVWDVTTTGCPEVDPPSSRPHPAPVFGVAFSADGERLGTACGDGVARIWNVKVAGAPVILEGHTRAVFAIAFHPRRDEVLTTSQDRTARVWDLRTGKVLRIFTGHTDMLGMGTYSPDGRLIATASADRSVRIWRADSEAPYGVLEAHTAPVFGVAFSADSSRLVTGSLDGTVRIWKVSESRGAQEPPSLSQLVGGVSKRVARELSPEECQTYLGTPECPPPVKLP